ncbi:MAG: penicillin acylase family protein [Armatimonadetes bacterium]|nr:penicillin acylase family protein [Armatimonadota bacterium]
MLASIAACLTLWQSPLERDRYGVPIIHAKTVDEAMMWAGYATAQDRMWQMEMSRRSSRSRLSEAFGKQYLEADKKQFQQFYTPKEIQAQFDRLPKNIKQWFQSYSDGVNKYLKEGDLPPEYAQNGLKPEPWTVLDSAAITINLVQLFGRGGAGELRNFAMFKYLELQPKIGKKALDVFDDFAWQNDPKAIPTCYPEDDPVKKPPTFPNPTAVETLKHLTKLPDLGIFELLPGVRVVSLEENKREWERLATPFKTGSYCAVVNKSMSATGNALLLSGPQMGFTIPSIIHETSIHAPGLDVAGMDVPGIPGVLIGATPDAAWGLTTGVADTEDIYVLHTIDQGYTVDGKNKKIVDTVYDLPVKGEADSKVVRQDTDYGPIVYEVKNKFTAFARKRAYEGHELQSYEAVAGLWNTKTKSDFDKTTKRATMNFNCFIALKSGDIGWRYLGWVPKRADGYDPRFPLPATKDAEWKGMISFDEMPHVWNPKRGWVCNWNNKPVSWWPNLDTPAWGEAFRNNVLVDFLTPAGKKTTQDLEQAVIRLATHSSTWNTFSPFLQDEPTFETFHGAMMAGSKDALVYNAFISALRNELFLPTTGNFAGNDNFALVAQPDVMARALRGETKFNYLNGRTAKQVIEAAIQKAEDTIPGKGFVASTIPVPSGSGLDPVLYRDRGTYIQIIQLGDRPVGENVVTPGVATTGPHSFDQVEFARDFRYKPMRILP